MSDALYGHLEHAAECFARHAERWALGAVQAAWNVCRAKPLLALWDRLEARVDGAHTWAETGRLSPELSRPREQTPRTLARSLLREAQQERSWWLEHHLDQVLEHAPDPQFISGLLAVARRPVVENPRMLTKLCLALKHVGPPYDVGPLQAMLARLRPEADDSAARLAFIIRKGREWVPPVLDEKALALVEALNEALRGREEQERRISAVRQQWLPRVYAAPDDDVARLVMADELLMLGDPLGELIALQCSAAPDAARIGQLLAENQDAWEWPLGPLVTTGRSRFERGFPVAVELSDAAMENLDPLPPPDMEWSTVREINLGQSGDRKEVAAWLGHPHLRGVTRLRGVGLSLTSNGFARLALLPRLAWLEIRGADPRDVALWAASPLTSKLERFDAVKAACWWLTARPAAEIPVEALLADSRFVGAFVDVLRSAASVGSRGLLLRRNCQLDAGDLARLRDAASSYAHVIWEPAG